MRGRVMLGPLALRVIGLGALLLLLLNPTRSHPAERGGAPLVLLDASLSMAGAGDVWPAALDTARRLAAGGPIWRFGDRLTAFDSGPPDGGASRLAPALAAAAARGGPLVVVTDGAIDDAARLPPDLRQRPRIIVLPRPPFVDAFVAAVEGPGRVSARDTVRLRLTYGIAGAPTADTSPPRVATLSISSGQRRLASRQVPLPDSGTLVTQFALPAARLRTGWSALDVRITAAGDAEPRDDVRRIAIDVSPQPTAVVFASPPGWEARFFARTLSDVARVPVQLFDEVEPGKWRDGSTLAPVSRDILERARNAARLVAAVGDAQRLARFTRRSGIVAWPLTGSVAGDWYVDPPPASFLASALAGIAWDSLPPIAALREATPEAASTTLLTARLARRGRPRPLVLLDDSAGARAVRVTGSGLWRWDFRGGASAEAYRSLVAAMADWLLGSGAPRADRVEPRSTVVANGFPLEWQWRGAGAPHTLAVALARDTGRGERVDTLRFDATGQASLRLPPGAYRWRLPDGPEHGLVVVEEYSDEWRPAAPTLAGQPGEPSGNRTETGARDHWWWYCIAIAAFAGEWALRRRRGLP